MPLDANKIGQDRAIQDPMDAYGAKYGRYKDACLTLTDKEKYANLAVPAGPDPQPYANMSNPLGPGRGD